MQTIKRFRIYFLFIIIYVVYSILISASQPSVSYNILYFFPHVFLNVILSAYVIVALASSLASG